MPEFVGNADKQTDFELLESQRGNLVTHENNLTQAGEQINGQLNALANNWAGNASTAFMSAASLWQKGYAEVLQGFNLLNKNLGSANEGFATAESGRSGQSSNSWTTT